MTQEALAGSTGLSDRTIRGLESGHTAQPRRETVNVLARALRLDGADTDRLLLAWRGSSRVDLLDLAPTARPQDDVIARQRAIASSIDERAGHDLAVVDAQGLLSHIFVRRALDIVAPGVDRYLWLSGSPVDPDLVALDSCSNVELGSRHAIGDNGMIVFELLFGRELAVGTTYTFEHRVTFDTTQLPDQHRPDTLHGRGLTIPVRSIFLQVQFALERLPSEVWHVFQPYIDGPTERVRRLPLSHFGFAELWLEPAPRGVHAIQWEW